MNVDVSGIFLHHLISVVFTFQSEGFNKNFTEIKSDTARK